MILVTLGSQKFQFDRLLKAVDQLVEEKFITEEVFAQVGYSTYVPKNYKWKQFLDHDEFADMTSQADMVITHCGTGAVIGAVKKEKKVIAVPRLSKYGEHVDDHQLQLLEQFKDLNLICSCMDTEKLKEAIEEARATEYDRIVSNNGAILESIAAFIDSI